MRRVLPGTHTTGKEEKTGSFCPSLGKETGGCGAAALETRQFVNKCSCRQDAASSRAVCLRGHIKDRLGLRTVCGSCDFSELLEKLTGTVQIETIHSVNSHERILAIIFFLNKCGRQIASGKIVFYTWFPQSPVHIQRSSQNVCISPSKKEFA